MQIRPKVHLDIQKHRSKPYGILRQYVKNPDGTTSRASLARLNNLSLEQLIMLRESLNNNTVPKTDFVIKSPKEYGASRACLMLAKKLGLDKMIYSRTNEQWVKDALALIVGRIIFSGSKLALSKKHTISTIWEQCGHKQNSSIDVNKHCYDIMDKLLERQSSIQKKLADACITDGSIVLYDITSSYFEGEYKNSEIINFGYNRDKKKGKQQIIIGLMCDKNGCPFAVEVFKGNTKDELTVMDKVRELKNRYSANNLIFVGDRGMITKSKFEEINRQNGQGEKPDFLRTISALTHRDIKKLCEKKDIQLTMFDEKNVVEIICDDTPDIRYGLCINPTMREKETRTRKILLQKTQEALEKIAASKRNNTKEQLGVRVGKVIGKYKMGKFVKIDEIDDTKLTWHFDQDKIDKEAALDGCYIVFTNVSKEDMAIDEVVKTYKNLAKVEQAFRNIKSAELEIRPVHHKTDERIKSHAFICMLSYYLMWHINKRLEPLFQNDVDGKNQLYTFNYIIERLKSITKNKVDFLGAETEIISQPDKEQSDILNLLGVTI